MPSPQVLQLSENHQAEQRKQLGLVAALVAAYFIRSMGNGEDIEAKVAGWVALVMPRIEGAREDSARRATRFYSLARALETAPGASLPTTSRPGQRSPVLEVFEVPQVALPTPREAVQTSLAVTGPVALRRKLRSFPEERNEVEFKKAVQTAAAGAARAAVRHIGNGGRLALTELVKNDERAVGWARQTRAQPCWFCAMLASRGAVYDDSSFEQSDPRFEGGDVMSTVKVHDGCQCFLTPIFSRDDANLSASTQEFAQLWADSTKGTSGAGMRKAFRAAYAERYGQAAAV